LCLGWWSYLPISRIDHLNYAQNKGRKGVTDMTENKNVKKEKDQKEKKPLTKPGEIEGKIEVSDRRERKDGPGGE